MENFKAFDGGEAFIQPERPFLLIYESEEDGLSVVWMEDEEKLLEVIKEVKGYGCNIIDAIEIESYREINIEDLYKEK